MGEGKLQISIYSNIYSALKEIIGNNVHDSFGLFYLPPAIGFLVLSIGIAAVAAPESMSKKFGITASESAIPYVISTGARDIFIGLSLLILCYLKEWHSLSRIIFCLGVVALSDFLIVLKYGNRKTSIIHLLGAISSFSYGTYLIAVL